MERYYNVELENDLKLDSLNYTDLAKKYSITRPTVRAYAKRIGLHKGNTKRLKKHTLNTEYFDVIDTEAKAYSLGFIYADGCNTRNGLQIGIQEEDKEILDFIKSEMNISNDLRYIKPYKSHWKPKWELCVKSIELSQKLTNVGCPPAKSLILKFPTFIPDTLMPHFIRGYFDGDGSISVCNRGYKRLSFVSASKDFILGLKDFFFTTLSLDLQLYQNKNSYSIMSSKVTTVNSVIEYMYANSSISMHRKYKKAYGLAEEKGGCHLIPAS